MRESAFYLIHLMSCALNDVQPCSLPEGASWDEVYALAEFNSVEGLAWTSARRVRDVPADMLKEWGATADMTLYRCVSYGIEREAVLAALADRGLSWLPLKGALLVDLYPSPHMRSMADNDILYGFVEEDPAGGFRIAGATEADRERTTARAVRVAVEVMEARGYRTISKTAGNHESFVKNPHFNFELHRRLVSPSSPQAAYYHNPWQRAVPVRLDSNAAEGAASDAGRGGRGREYRFSDDDFYLHLVSHAFKHYDASGCGIRFLVDQLVFLRARGKGLDRSYLADELSKLGLRDFEQWTRRLSFRALEDPRAACRCAQGRDAERGPTQKTAGLSDADQARLLRLMNGGTYGTWQTVMERRLDAIRADSPNDDADVKKRYVASRVFVSEEQMQEAFPFFWRHAWMRPLLPLYRMGRGLVRNPKKIACEIKALRRLR